MNILARLLDSIFVPRESELLLRSISNDALSAYFNPQLLELEELSVMALARYEESVVRAAIIEAKYHRNTNAAQLLARLVAEYIGEELVGWRSFDESPIAIIPVPLSPARRASRGYNQAEIIARKAIACMPGKAVLCPDLLVRVRDTPPQTTLGGNLRRKNMRDAFAVRKSPEPATRYILFDDVVTTGATLSAAAAALCADGARHVLPLALAH